MLQIPKGQTTEAEREILRKLRVWIAALAAACLVVGVSIGAMLSRTRVAALDDPPPSPAQIARAPEALSASFAEIARRVRRPSRGVGSGFIVDPKGIVLTNYHVVEGMSSIMVKLQTGEQLRGTVVGTDEETDVAVVKVNAGRELPRRPPGPPRRGAGRRGGARRRLPVRPGAEVHRRHHLDQGAADRPGSE